MAKSKAELLAEKMERERVARAAFEAGQKPILEAVSTEQGAGETQQQPAKETPAPEVPKVEKAPAAPAKEKAKPSEKPFEKSEEDQQKSFFDLDEIGNFRRPEKKTYSIYLSVDTMNEVEKRARKARMGSSSAYLDELLKRVLGL